MPASTSPLFAPIPDPIGSPSGGTDLGAPRVSPRGHLLWADERGQSPPQPPDTAFENQSENAAPQSGPTMAEPYPSALRQAFARGPGHGILHVGAVEVGTPLAPAWAFWRDFGARVVAALCARPPVDTDTPGLIPAGRTLPPPPPPDELWALADRAPPMDGGEYLTADVLAELWTATAHAFEVERAESGLDAAAFLKSLNPAWNQVGRVHFHLAENRKDPDAPFAFLATYTSRLSSTATPQHLPLAAALRESAASGDRARLRSLLQPVQRAAEECDWLKRLVESNELFQPLRFTAHEALRLLNDTPILERAGVVVRMPAHWGGGRPSRPQAQATVGGAVPSNLTASALLDFRVDVTLDGEPLNAQEIAEILRRDAGLSLLRGRWVEINPAQLKATLERLKAIEARANAEGLSFVEAARLLADAHFDTTDGSDLAWGEAAEWSRVIAGPWLGEVLKGLRSPEGLAAVDPGPELKATLRPYQQVGLRWLYLLSRLGLGACLADDMGLGKTIQIIALLLVLRREGLQAVPRKTSGAAAAKRSATTPAGSARRPSLLVAPASLLANWEAELHRFAPSLTRLIAHPSNLSAWGNGQAPDADTLARTDVVITSYGTLLRWPWLKETAWRLVVLDEAQAIKNPGAKQAQGVKTLKAEARIALTGTPVENRLGDLWSLFDFLNPGLLGSASEFNRFVKKLGQAAAQGKGTAGFAPLRELVRPYILRRLKTDKTVIADLPDKTEMKSYCLLSTAQVAHYGQVVAALKEALEKADGIQRRGIVLSSLMRLKQICNHPSQWLGDGGYDPAHSGKFQRLRELTEIIATKQEKVLVFTQFAELTAPLAAFLGGVFGRAGRILMGTTPVAQRQALVREFQEDENVPFFVLSLKAGGSGLNLTAASHVIHFDRWWNPAVEAQATDRAYRIGQRRNVLIHKFVCRGTVEEKIDDLIEAKRGLSDAALASTAETILTEMSDAELLRMVSLDLKQALHEG